MRAPLTALTKAAVLLVGVLVAALSGCASYDGGGLVPGQATKRDARALMGEPAAVHPAESGQKFVESWEYPRGPAGKHTFMLRFAADDQLVQIDQVLQPKTLAQIKTGTTTQANIRSLLGRPGFVRPTRNGGASWDYYSVSQTGFMRAMIISVDFDAEGLVTAFGEREDPATWAHPSPRR